MNDVFFLKEAMMTAQPKPITNQLQHEEALARFEALLAASDGSSEADEREILAILIEQYEKVAFPIPP